MKKLTRQNRYIAKILYRDSMAQFLASANILATSLSEAKKHILAKHVGAVRVVSIKRDFSW